MTLNFKSLNHAMATGMLVAHLLDHGVHVHMEIDDNGEDYTPRMNVFIPVLDAVITFEVLPAEEDE
jgi:hypothetical protein